MLSDMKVCGSLVYARFPSEQNFKMDFTFARTHTMRKYAPLEINNVYFYSKMSRQETCNLSEHSFTQLYSGSYNLLIFFASQSQSVSSAFVEIRLFPNRRHQFSLDFGHIILYYYSVLFYECFLCSVI